MINTLAVSGYRSLRDVTLTLGSLNVVTGANGTGKSSLYRSLRLLAEVAQGRLIGSIAAEGGLTSTLWAGPESISRSMRSGEHPVQGGARRSSPINLRLGFAADELGYAIDLGLPAPEKPPPEIPSPFSRDPEIKVEAMWSGGTLGRSNLYAERRGPGVRLRSGETGEWKQAFTDLSSFDSMVTHCADPVDGLELLQMRERMRSWRFYDNLRTDREAPARRPQIMTYTPVLAGDGSDLASAIATIRIIGDGRAFDEAIDDAFPGSRVDFRADDYGSVQMYQHGLLRPLDASELSDGTLRYLLLTAALFSPRLPELMILNEPEASLHPDLLDPLARLLIAASRTCQIIVVSHAERLVEALRASGACEEFVLEKSFGETVIEGASAPGWVWPKR